jgi:hypothetical protein
MENLKENYPPSDDEMESVSPTAPEPITKLQRFDRLFQKGTRTFGELAKEIQRRKPYIPDGCLTVDIKCEGLPCTDAEAIAYFGPLLLTAGVKGTIQLVKLFTLDNGTKCFSFEGMCPIHKEVHDSYGNWQYKVVPGKYGGFKCWTDNSWITSYKWEDMPLLQ